jgi:diguanylate cyclase (GGDEF)-like protein
VMQHVAQIMREVVGETGGAYRFGGEEFTVLLPNTDAEAAFERAEALRTRIKDAPLAHHGRILGNITISLGVAVAPHDAPAATLLRRADAALLQAKAAGRDRTVSASAVAEQRRAV